MIDLSQFLTGSIPTTGVVSAPGAPVDGDGTDGFDAILSQLAALLNPTATPMPAAMPTLPGLPTLGLAPSSSPVNPGIADSGGDSVSPNTDQDSAVATTALPTKSMVIPMFVAVTTVTPIPTQPVVTDDPPVAVETPAPKGDDDTPVAADALVAAVRIGLGLPATPAPITTTSHETATVPEHAVAVGRTGVMPTLPEHAHATLPLPVGIGRRFPLAPPVLPTTASEETDGAPASVDLLGSDVPAMGDPAPIVMSTLTPDAAPVDVVTMPAPTDVPPGPVNDIAVPDVPVSGQPVAEKPKADAPVPVPTFDNTAPDETDRLAAIAPPLVSKADDPVDKNDTTDTIVAPHNDDAPPQAATAVAHAANASRPEHTEHTERAASTHEANGIGAPLRAALRERSTPKRDDSFELTVRLDPPELGAVRVRVVTQGDNVKITLRAENPEARAVLQERHEDVKTILRNEGFNLDGFDVDTGEGRQQQSEQPNRRRAATPAPTFEEPVVDDGALRL